MTQEHHHTAEKIEIDRDKLWACAGYVFFPLPLIFIKNRTNFLNYHVNQAIILAIVSIAGQFVFWILSGGWFGAFLGEVFKILVIIWFIIGIANVTHKKMKPLPVIGNLFNFVK